MSGTAKKRAVKNENDQTSPEPLDYDLVQVMAKCGDHELIRSLAQRLLEGGLRADEARAAVKAVLKKEPADPDLKKPGGILRALRRSPLVGADLDLSRPWDEGRKVDL